MKENRRNWNVTWQRGGKALNEITKNTEQIDPTENSVRDIKDRNSKVSKTKRK